MIFFSCSNIAGSLPFLPSVESILALPMEHMDGYKLPQVFGPDTLALAQTFRHRAVKPMRISLRNEQRCWDIAVAEGERLLRAGFEETR